MTELIIEVPGGNMQLEGEVAQMNMQGVSLKGDKGDKGDPGYTPQKGVDYFTEEDIESLGIDKKADKAETLAGYGIGDAYTKREVDDALSGKMSVKEIYEYDVEMCANGIYLVTGEGEGISNNDWIPYYIIATKSQPPSGMYDYTIPVQQVKISGNGFIQWRDGAEISKLETFTHGGTYRKVTYSWNEWNSVVSSADYASDMGDISAALEQVNGVFNSIAMSWADEVIIPVNTVVEPILLENATAFSFAEAVVGKDNEWIFSIQQGATSYDVVLPEIHWGFGYAPTFSANTITQCRLYYIGNKLCGEWTAVNL